MPDPKFERILQNIRTHAFTHLPTGRRATTNLHLDERVIAPGEAIGPKRQQITVRRPSVMVFADDQPDRDFSHSCRYILYEAETGNMREEIPAQFPPYVGRKPETLKAFHEPVKLMPGLIHAQPWAIRRIPILVPDGERYAILFSGMSNLRHVHNIEFLYRTLVNDYSFKASNVYVLNFDGTLNSQDGVTGNYVDGTHYQMHVSGQGTRTALDAAIDDVKGKLKDHDLLFLYTGNHGGWAGVPGSADLCTWPAWDGYHASDMATKLGTLPKFRKFMVMMSQCHSGGFNQPILLSSKADATGIAAAVIEAESSSVCYDWNYFARDWTSAQAGHDPYFNPLTFNPDANGDGNIQADEAFSYAYAHRPAGNDPIFTQGSAAGGDITLGQQYRIVWWWQRIVLEALQEHWHLPPEEYYKHVREIQPQLSQLAMELDGESNRLQEEYRRKVTKLVGERMGMPVR